MSGDDVTFVPAESTTTSAPRPTDPPASRRASRLRLPDDLKSKIDARASSEGVSTNTWIVRVLEGSSRSRRRATSNQVGDSRGSGRAYRRLHAHLHHPERHTRSSSTIPLALSTCEPQGAVRPPSSCSRRAPRARRSSTSRLSTAPRPAARPSSPSRSPTLDRSPRRRSAVDVAVHRTGGLRRASRCQRGRFGPPLTRNESGDVRLRGTVGDVDVALPCAGPHRRDRHRSLSIKTASGDLDARHGLAARSRSAPVSGDVTVESANDEASITVVSGDVTLSKRASSSSTSSR